MHSTPCHFKPDPRQALFKSKFKSVGLVAKHDDPQVADAVTAIAAFLRSRGAQALFHDASAEAWPGLGAQAGLEVVSTSGLGERADLVIVIGGDGTFLGAARSLCGHDVPLLGVNLGRLGFLADISAAETTERLTEIFDGDYLSEKRFLLSATLDRQGDELLQLDAFNEVVAHKRNIARLVSFQTRIDGRLVNTQRSDGLIVATPTGSTAYALSGGGPILHPNIDAIVLVPICPHTLSSRPLVVPGASRVEVIIDPAESREAQLTCDGQSAHELLPGDRIVIEQRTPWVQLIHPPGYDHYQTLRTKLKWANST